MKTLVTVITPTYNHEKYIRKCIESVIDQTYKDWKMIIVVDGSTDKTIDIVKEYAKNDKRIRIVSHDKHWGIPKLAETYNQAIRLCRTKYFAILEGDDFWPKDKLDKQIDYIKNKNVVFAFGNCILVSGGGSPIKLVTYKYDRSLITNSPVGAAVRLFATLNFSIYLSTVIIRKKEFLSIGGFKKDKYFPFPDVPTFLRLALKGKFCYQNEVLGYYRKSSNSAWFDYVSKTSAMGREELSKSVNSFIKHNSNNTYISKINIEDVISSQNRYINSKKNRKGLSIFVNKLAFKNNFNPLSVIFWVQYMLYKIKKYL